MALSKLQPPCDGCKYNGVRIDPKGYADVDPRDMPAMIAEGWKTYPEVIEVEEPRKPTKKGKSDV